MSEYIEIPTAYQLKRKTLSQVPSFPYLNEYGIYDYYANKFTFYLNWHYPLL